MVNDVKAYVFKKDKGKFLVWEVTLTEGENIIKVVATLGEEVVIKTVNVTYTPE